MQVAGKRIGGRFRIVAGELEIDGAIIGVERGQVTVCQAPEAWALVFPQGMVEIQLDTPGCVCPETANRGWENLAFGQRLGCVWVVLVEGDGRGRAGIERGVNLAFRP